jgi:hypothetical protein
MNPAIRLAGAAVLVLAVSGAVILAMRPAADVGPPSTPAPTPSAAPQASPSDPIAAYRTARNQICMAAVQAFTDNNDLVGLYDASTPPDRRTIVNANAQAIADAIATMATDLAKLESPAELADAHIADVAHAQNEAAIFAVAMKALVEGRLSDAQAMEQAEEAASNLRRPFETENNLFNCP